MPRVKTRSVYSVENFRGLDKENKLIKVQPFRAADGKNFIIDSGTLKTRPSLAFHDELNVFIHSQDKLIDVYSYKDVKIYITEKRFYFSYNNQVYSDQSPSNFLHLGFEEGFQIDFKDKKPLFREEKDALFIFGLGSVFVFSTFDDKGFLYDIRYKPSNPFGVHEKENHERYEDLPETYVPTLFIGNNRFEDVNLLSSKHNYKLFSQTQGQSGAKKSYFLPTFFDEEKHESFQAEIEFYGGRLDDVSVLPIFMGVEGENFLESEKVDIYGDPIDVEGIGSEFEPAEIEQIFRPSVAFETHRDENNQIDIPISRLFNLNANIFFGMRMRFTQITVFDYLINFFKENQSEIDTWTENKYIVFSMPYEVKEIVKDKDTNFVVQENMIRDDVKVFVQIRKFDMNPITFEEESYIERVERVSDTTKRFPPFIGGLELQTGSGYEQNREYDLNNGFAINTNNFTKNNFHSLIRSLLESKINDLVGVEKVKINAKIFEEKEGELTISVSNPTLVASKPHVFPFETNPTFYMFYPTFNLETDIYPLGITSDEIGVPHFVTLPVTETDWDSMTLGVLPLPNLSIRNLIRDTLEQQIGQVEGFVSGKVFCLLPVYAYAPVPFEHQFGRKSYIIKADFVMNYEGEYQKRRSVQTIIDINTQLAPIEDNLYDFSFNDDRKAFELKIKDFFFDYNNEPSILVKTKFSKNPDFYKIARTRFGIDFGSENRLFLAGDPEYPNIDRFNVSNDLLGGNIKNQSYELSYFPSKNYRVLGGKAPINGYVVATDNQLYVTKEKMSNDETFYIRERNLLDDGQVTYFEYKTNINQSPINHNCLVRFANDILMLTKNGLYGIEISSNVLTNERLDKLRSGFINKDLKETIKNANQEKVFMLENNEYLYIFINKDVYVADSRYIDVNPNAKIDNQSYEIVKWEFPIEFSNGYFKDNHIFLIHENQAKIYTFGEDNYDYVSRKEAHALSDMVNTNHPSIPETYRSLLNPVTNEDVFVNPVNYKVFLYQEAYIKVADSNDYELDGNLISIINPMVFRMFVDGQRIFFKEGNDYIENKIVAFDEDREKFSYQHTKNGDKTTLYVSAQDFPLYITQVLDIPITPIGHPNPDFVKNFSFSIFPQLEPEIIVYDGEDKQDYIDYLIERINENEENQLIEFKTSGSKPIRIERRALIETVWVSGVTDFGNNMVEKTMFKVNVYASRISDSNKVFIGYKTMKTIRDFAFGDKTSPMLKTPESYGIATTFGFQSLNFNIFGLNTFSEMGSSIPMKENNFLYMQFLVLGLGRVELNGFKVIFKENRILKTIG